uniref:RING-type E3 ubiquitin transferase n=1 Tax=Manihot esculenta TaxID=3983 RepID=A0A2C9UMP3_MANES
MASQSQLAEVSSAFERMLRRRDLSLFLPLILGVTGTNPDQERIILINPFTQGMVMIEGAGDLGSLLRELATKNGQPPASKAFIEALPSVEISEIGDHDCECVICLKEWELGGLAKEMLCNHRFHAHCIKKWLGIHGSCPVCRYKMPVDEVDLGKQREEEEEEEEEKEGRERRRFQREIWVGFSFNNNRRKMR